MRVQLWLQRWGRLSAQLLIAGILMGVSAFGDAPLIEAAKNGDRAAIRDLLRRRIDVNLAARDGATALHWAAQSDDAEAADLLIRAGAKVNAANVYGVTPLVLACQNGSAGIVERLLQAGANPNLAL